MKWRQVCPDFLVRTFKVCADQEERTICQFHYTTWPDHGVPNSVHPILELVRLMRDVQSTESRPILVHCSAGCGRTGTLCSIDYVWALLRTGKLKPDFSLFEIIKDMRRQRIAMVQTVEQFILCYRAVATLFEQHLKLIDTHTYENISNSGEPLGIELHSEPPSLPEQVTQPTAFHFDQPSTSDSSKELENEKTLLKRSDSDSMSSTSNEEVKPHEKLVGKATVFRRPSIAKLKALLDNNDVNSMQTSSDSVSSLQRSQSIKEDIRNLNFNFQLEINPSKSQSIKKSYTLNSAAKFTIYKKHLSVGNLKFDDDCPSTDNDNQPNMPNEPAQNESNNSEEISGEIKINSELNYSLNDRNNANFSKSNTFNQNNHTEHSPNKSFPSQNQNPSSKPNTSEQQYMFHKPVLSYMHQYEPKACYTELRQRSQSQLQPRPPSIDSVSNAPPKPPRTYQHVMDDSCIFRTSEGRLIVTVAQPKKSSINNNFMPINVASNQFSYVPTQMYEQMQANKFVSSPNLAIQQDQSNPYGQFSSQMNNDVLKSNRLYSNNMNGGNPSMYSNNFAPKQASYMRPMSVRQQMNVPQDAYSQFMDNNMKYVDVLSSQNFQHYQAKPIILQPPGYYEPIYGSTSRPPFMVPMQTTRQQPNQFIPMLPPRPRSISQGTFQPVNCNYESIYSNHEMMFKPANQVNQSFTNVPNPSSSNIITVPPSVTAKENVYAEIGTIKSNDEPSHKKNQHKLTNQKEPNPVKSNPLSKIRNAFKSLKSKKIHKEEDISNKDKLSLDTNNKSPLSGM